MVLAVAVIGSAVAQAPLITIEPVAQGSNAERRFKLDGRGPTDVSVLKLTLKPGGDLGWHMHPGPAIVVVTKGSLTEYHSNGCITLHPAGSSFYEEAGEVHRAANNGGTDAEGYVTFLLPAGTQPLIPAPEPKLRACGQDDKHTHGN